MLTSIKKNLIKFQFQSRFIFNFDSNNIDILQLCEDTSSKRTLFDPDRPSSAPILPISLLVTLLAYLTNILFI